MPEWSKGVDSRSTVVIRVGSNPTLVRGLWNDIKLIHICLSSSVGRAQDS